MWQTIDTAPSDAIVVVLTKGGQAVVAVHMDFQEGLKAWQAAREDEHPKCWHEGVCWSDQNADGEPSDPPAFWAWPPHGWDQ